MVEEKVKSINFYEKNTMKLGVSFRKELWKLYLSDYKFVQPNQMHGGCNNVETDEL